MVNNEEGVIYDCGDRFMHSTRNKHMFRQDNRNTLSNSVNAPRFSSIVILLLGT